MNKLNKIKNSTLVSLIILVGCQSPQQQISNTVSVPKISPSISNNTILASTTITSNQVSVSPTPTKTTIQQESKEKNNDEEIIKQMILSNPDYFPENINTDDDGLEATVPNNGGVVFATVPNNGGVVFLADNQDSESFGTKAIIDKLVEKNTLIKNRIKEQIREKINESISRVTRKNIGVPKKDFKITFNSDKTQADVTLITTFTREVTLNRKINPVIKRFKEESVINSVFIREDNVWKLNQISPIDSKTIQQNIKIKIESIKIIVHSDKNNIKTTELEINNLKNKAKLLNLAKGDIVTIEAKVVSSDSTLDVPLQVFARLSSTKTRIPLYDDGSSDILADAETKKVSGDSIKNDDIYTTNIFLNSKKGVNYLIIDVLNPLSDSQKSIDNFNYITKSIPIVIM